VQFDVKILQGLCLEKISVATLLISISGNKKKRKPRIQSDTLADSFNCQVESKLSKARRVKVIG
jgi:hypothetical protein